MVIEGGCYCGALRYRAEGEPLFLSLIHISEPTRLDARSRMPSSA